MLYSTLEKVQRAVPLVRVYQHVDDLAQCALGHQTAEIKDMVDAAENYHSLHVTQVAPGHLAHADPLLFRCQNRNSVAQRAAGTWGSFSVSREGPASWASTRVEAPDGLSAQKTQGLSPSHPKSVRSPQHQCVAMLQLWGGGHGHRALHRARYQIALRTPCAPVSRPALLLGCTTMWTPLGLSGSNSGWFFGTTLTNFFACACAELGS